MEAATEEPRSTSRSCVSANVGVTSNTVVRSQSTRSKLSSVTLDIINSISPGSSKALTSAFLEVIRKASETATPAPENVPATDSLACQLCGCAFYRPVTLPCGHTFCKSCLHKDAVKCCPNCGQKLPARLETNVLIKTLLEKWCPAQINAARLLEEGNRLLKDHAEEALVKFKDALAAAPNNHAVLCSRSQAFYQLNMLQESLADADQVTRIKPQWSKGYYRRGMALSALGHNEEALISFGICIALDNNVYAVKPDVTRLLQRLFQNNSMLIYHIRIPTLFYVGVLEPCRNQASSFMRQRIIGMSLFAGLGTRRNWIGYTHYTIKPTECGVKTTSSSFVVNSNSVEPADFDCILCCRTLWRPITTPCGHTYCSMCLERCLDYRSTCPLCMTSLADYLSVHGKQVTDWVERALVLTVPSAYAARMLLHREEVLAPPAADTPVFVCTTAFPSVSCPLFVFEPRYRLMVRRCVEAGTRQFAMAAACIVNQHGAKRYADFGTMLEIKDWVLLADGCSILSTVGMRRFQVMSRGEKDGYDTARVQYITDTPIPAHRYNDVCELHDFVYRKGRRWFNELTSSLQTDTSTTFLLTIFVTRLYFMKTLILMFFLLQVGILRTTCLEKRLKVIAKTLDHIVQCQQYQGLTRHKPLKRSEEPTVVETNS
ncbi:LON peptidase N-terminal domain and RING finger protein 3 [Nilaparvata lugens]|uniref:LON peptidase N-terminal domain and RING finger protein 3 n=1 Tax=Nilaparvata lugens TaxID=108931 RepID=UPI00193DEA50|nr:LON peptidase N-terminal domain and RING finger protein 3 [Nilaparvata lugens]